MPRSGIWLSNSFLVKPSNLDEDRILRECVNRLVLVTRNVFAKMTNDWSDKGLHEVRPKIEKEVHWWMD